MQTDDMRSRNLLKPASEHDSRVQGTLGHTGHEGGVTLETATQEEAGLKDKSTSQHLQWSCLMT